MSKEPLYGMGDRVRVVKFGSLVFLRKSENPLDCMFQDSPIIYDNGTTCWIDISPYLVGQEGIIDGLSDVQGIYKYSISGIKQKHAWYTEEQLEIVKRNPNR